MKTRSNKELGHFIGWDPDRPDRTPKSFYTKRFLVLDFVTWTFRVTDDVLDTHLNDYIIELPETHEFVAMRDNYTHKKTTKDKPYISRNACIKYNKDARVVDVGMILENPRQNNPVKPISDDCPF